MSERYYTLEEARALLPRLRPVAERIVKTHRELQHIASEDLAPRPTPDAPVPPAYFRRLVAMSRMEQALSGMGILLKDHGQGLLDFPALYGGRIVLLCWRVGEKDIGFWHELESGFSGRRPLSDLPPATPVD